MSNASSKGFAFIIPLIVIAILISAVAVYLSSRSYSEHTQIIVENPSYDQESERNLYTEERFEAIAPPKNQPIVIQDQKQSIIENTPKPLTESSQKLLTAAELAEFTDWADERGIALQGVEASVDDMYYNRYEPAKHNVSLSQIPGLMLAYTSLKNIPGDVLEVMRDKTIYFSTSNERPYANLTGDYGGTLKNTKPGFILTQPILQMSAAHELGHIVAYHGIEGLYGFTASFADLKEEYDMLFDTKGIGYPPAQTPKGYISSYAAANKAENFAEHFAYYVGQAGDFKAKMAEDNLLAKKYDFFDAKLFRPPGSRKLSCQSNLSPVFTSHITDIAKVNYVVAPPTMGAGPSLKPHSYIGTNGQNVPVYAPADATLKSGAHYVGGPYTVELQISCQVTIRFGHITDPVDAIKNLLPAEAQPDSRTQELKSVAFEAGELIGYTTGTSGAGNWDFGVYDSATSNRYASDPAWNNSDTYTTAVCPFDYFAPELKSQYYARFDSQILGGNPPDGESFCQG